MLVATASDTSGPPPMPSTASRTIAKAGSAATTAPNPTRLATLITGSAEALTPASMVARRSGMRRTLRASAVRMAQVSAVMTDQTPVTGGAATRRPIRGLARKLRSSRGRTIRDRTRLTRITTTIGAAAAANDGGCRRDLAVRDLGRIEFARRRRALAQRVVVRQRLRGPDVRRRQTLRRSPLPRPPGAAATTDRNPA